MTVEEQLPRERDNGRVRFGGDGRARSIPNGDYKVIPIDTIKEHPRNPRRGEIDLIAESIDENGLYGALLIQKSTGFILKGNHTYRAARELGMKEVPVIELDVDDYRAMRIMLVDNKSSDHATYDDQELASILDELANATDSGLRGTGYNQEELEDIMARLTPPSLDELEDQYGEPGAEDFWPVIKLKVPPEVENRFHEAMSAMEGEAEFKKFSNMVELAMANAPELVEAPRNGRK